MAAIGCSLSGKFTSSASSLRTIALEICLVCFLYFQIRHLNMLPRSSSFTSSATASTHENVKPTVDVRHHESLQNLPQCPRPTRPMLSRPLNIEHSSQAYFAHPPANVKRTNAIGAVLVATQNLPQLEKKSELPVETIKRSIVQDDLENIQERLNEILITAPTNNANESSLLPTEQASTTEYFTPKISIDEHGKKKLDERENQSIHEAHDDDDDDDLCRTYFSLIL